MKRFILIALLLSVVGLTAQAQVTSQNARRVYSGTAVPNWACMPGPIWRDIYIRTTDNSEYQCTAAPNVWTKVVSGGTPGTVTSVSGTANQINVATGTTTPVLSLSSTLVAPGTVSATTSVTSPIYISGAANPADAGAIRLGNNENIAWEAATPGTDLTLGVNASDVLVSSAAFSALSLAGAGITSTKDGATFTFAASNGANAAYITGSNTSGNLFLVVEGSAGASFSGSTANAIILGNTVAKPIEFYTNAVKVFSLASGGAAAFSGSVAITGNATIQGALNFAADAGSTDDYAITLAPAPAAYTTGMYIAFTANTANTGACTVNVNGLGAKALKRGVSTDPGDNFIKAGSVVMAIYDGVAFQMIQPAAQ